VGKIRTEGRTGRVENQGGARVGTPLKLPLKSIPIMHLMLLKNYIIITIELLKYKYKVLLHRARFINWGASENKGGAP
jgi:hypothetical protein